MKKYQLLERLEKAWATFQESYVGLSDPQLMEPGVMGDWSVKDILAHVTCAGYLGYPFYYQARYH